MCALLGGFFVYVAIPQFDPPVKLTGEFRDDLPIFVWVFILIIGLALIFVAWRLWRKGRSVKPN